MKWMCCGGRAGCCSHVPAVVPDCSWPGLRWLFSSGFAYWLCLTLAARGTAGEMDDRLDLLSSMFYLQNNGLREREIDMRAMLGVRVHNVF